MSDKLDRFTKRARRVLTLAQEEALRLNHNYIGTEHLLLGLVREENGVAVKVLRELGVEPNQVIRAVERTVGRGERAPFGKPTLAPRTKRVIELAVDEARLMGHHYIGTEHLLLGLVREGEGIAVNVLRGLGVNLDRVRTQTARNILQSQVQNKDKQKKESKTPLMDQLGFDLTAAAEEGRLDPVVGRITEIERLIQILSRRTKNNPALIGEPGVGKTAIVEGLAQRIIEGDVPELLLDAANILKPALSRGELQVIGATTLDEYRKHIESDAALERRFQPILVEEPTIEETIKILHGVRSRYEDHHKLQITDEALDAAAQLAARYVPDRFMPDKAIDVIDEAGSRVRMYKAPHAANLRETFKDLKKLPRVTPEDVAEVVSMWTGVPVNRIAGEERVRLLEMEKVIRQRIIGQEEPVKAICKAVRRARAGLKDPSRPIGSFMFLGPTGVGKSETAKTLAEFMFGSDEALIKLDMSEFMERHNVSRLVGAPPGYIGYEEGGQLTESVRRRPYSVILLDEIEKAHPEAFNMLLQIMEDGHLSDAKGRRVDFRNTLILMTSNIGAKLIQGANKLGFSITQDETEESRDQEYETMKAKVMD